MKLDNTKSVPEPTLRRLPEYARLLRRLQKRERPVVSCSHIGDELHLDPTQVRKDLAFTGIVGKPRVGYEVPALLDAIETFLGWNDVKKAFLIGAGSLGTALLGYQQFNHYGLNIAAVFDADPVKIGAVIHGKEVLPVDKIHDLAERMHALVGIIAVPAEAAQSAADILVLSGVRAIWNLAPVALSLPDDIIVQREDIFASLAVLSNKLSAMLSREHQSQAPYQSNN